MKNELASAKPPRIAKLIRAFELTRLFFLLYYSYLFVFFFFFLFFSTLSLFLSPSLSNELMQNMCDSYLSHPSKIIKIENEHVKFPDVTFNFIIDIFYTQMFTF